MAVAADGSSFRQVIMRFGMLIAEQALNHINNIHPAACTKNAIDASNTPGKRLLANHEYFLVPNGMVEALVFEAAAAGLVVIEEVGPASASESNDGSGVTFGGEGVTFGGQGVTW